MHAILAPLGAAVWLRGPTQALPKGINKYEVTATTVLEEMVLECLAARHLGLLEARAVMAECRGRDTGRGGAGRLLATQWNSRQRPRGWSGRLGVAVFSGLRAHAPILHDPVTSLSQVGRGVAGPSLAPRKGCSCSDGKAVSGQMA